MTKVTAYWLYKVWEDVTELERGEELFIDPKRWDRSPFTIVQGVNRLLRSLEGDGLIERIEYAVSVIDNKVRVRRV